MNILLDFNFKTPINAFQYQAFSTGMLLAKDKPEALDWLLSRCLKICYNGTNLCIYFPGDCPVLFRELLDENNDCFNRCQLNLPITYLQEKPQYILKIIIDIIKRGYYVYGYYNEYYVANRTSFKKVHFLHDYLIIGMNEEDEIFHIVGYNDKMIYESTDINFSSYLEAVFNSELSTSGVYFYKLKENYSYSFDMELAKHSIYEFIHSIDTSRYNDKSLIYGEKAMNYFNSNINDLLNKQLALQNLRVLYEYTICIEKCIQYFNNHNLIENEKILKNCKSNEIENKDLVYLGIKYDMTQSNSLQHKIGNKVNIITNNIVEIMHLIKL